MWQTRSKRRQTATETDVCELMEARFLFLYLRRKSTFLVALLNTRSELISAHHPAKNSTDDSPSTLPPPHRC